MSAGWNDDGGEEEMTAGGGIRKHTSQAVFSSHQKYYCDVCGVAIISYNIKGYYLNTTDWDKLDKLQKCVGKAELAREMKNVDEHTRYMFKWKHTAENLPSYKTHKMEKAVRSGPMDRFFPNGGIG